MPRCETCGTDGNEAVPGISAASRVKIKEFALPRACIGAPPRLFLVHFDEVFADSERGGTTQTAMDNALSAIADHRDYVPAGQNESRAFQKYFLDEQRAGPIVILGSVYQPDGGKVVEVLPMLGAGDDSRKIATVPVTGKFEKHCLYLVRHRLDELCKG